MSGALMRDAGMQRAIDGAGGVRALARKMGQAPSSISRLRQAPRDRLFELARHSGVEPEVIRPDLADWIEAERRRGWMERARSRFAISSGLGLGTAKVRRGGDAAVMDLLDLGLVVAAVKFAASERGLSSVAVISARGGQGGAPTPEQSARALAMGLAVTVGRVSAETVAGVMGVSRQAVDNAAERYLRARDGDDADDLDGGRVLERGRLRRAKTADEGLWAAERRFLQQLAGEA